MIKYLRGDATKPIGDGNKYIVHCCNDIGAWGAGFVLAISRRWVKPEIRYRLMKERNLGDIEIVAVEKDISVVNLIGQRGIGIKDGIPPISYQAIDTGFGKLAECLKDIPNSSIHMPRIGCGLAGGDWTKIEPLIINRFSMSVYVYDF